ncbi:FAD dependent oxidoreductase [Symmachiella macrocystis]|uniref:FAD dependent oxidoreductase n=1 Tax=Symmachiella macrocystis TaxID=2527985 RepID=A0A5C6BAK1_9PLAN|nr:FAD-dependent oxidoreductase [Symmachiella macrocystis]TWU08747.1 FAD dependent oxidoreductase [Symmachiella macrocystis]
MHTSILLTAILLAPAAAPQTVETDLLVVGGSESAVAVAVQAARLGVRRIVLVNDIDWLGGQFTAEGLGAVDEWTIYKGKREPFPRSGLFLEIMNAIEADMQQKYGLPRPGNGFCSWTTCEPRDTERLFRELVAPYLKSSGGPLEIFGNYEPQQVSVSDGAVTGVEFVSTQPGQPSLTVQAKLTVDASDWGDVVRLSGAAYMRGPDLKSAFDEPGAPENQTAVRPNELNPITYCMILRETDAPTVIPQPAHYDERRYYGTTLATKEEFGRLGWPRGTMSPRVPAWKESTMANGPYGEQPSVYTHRRLVDRRHNELQAGSESILVNWPLQDYPTYNFPAYLRDQLEATEPGASEKNLVDMTPAQRRLVFADAKLHALGMLYHLQTTVHEKDPSQAVSFRDMALTDEFGTPDKMPLKPYVREGLRLDALYVLREQDIRDIDGKQSWATVMVPDNLFGFQFNIDFHPTKRIFLNDDPSGPWAHIHSSYRNWGTHTDRSGFPLRSLVPKEMGGLLVAGKNLGYTSIVSSAVRLHGHGMLAGQATGALAAMALREGVPPREVAADWKRIRELQTQLVSPSSDPKTGQNPPGVLLWPYHDLPVEAEYFAAANQLAIRMILPGDQGLQDFEPDRVVTRREMARTIARAALSTGQFTDFDYSTNTDRPAFSDVDIFDADYAAIESLQRWKLITGDKKFHPEQPATWEFLRSLAGKLNWTVADSSTEPGTPLTRAGLAQALWGAIQERPDGTLEATANYLQPGHDADKDGVEDLNDPLPFDRDNDGLPDRLDADDTGNGLPDRVAVDGLSVRRFNFTGRGAAQVPGYHNDSGLAFDDERGFGWRTDISANHRRRHQHPDPVKDSFLFTRKTAVWECALPNGTYRVSVTVGDSGHAQPGQQLSVEGMPAVNNVDTALGRFHTASVTAKVTDGRLTIEMGTENPRLNTCLNAVTMMSVTTSSEKSSAD